jgi:hypothetical protein
MPTAMRSAANASELVSFVPVVALMLPPTCGQTEAKTTDSETHPLFYMANLTLLQGETPWLLAAS